MNISDISFYKDLGLSISEIGGMDQCSVEAHKEILLEKTGLLKNKIAELEASIRKIEKRLLAISEAERLSLIDFEIGDVDTEYIIPFRLDDIERLSMYMENPYLYSRVQHSSDISRETRGITVNDIEDTNCSILWKKSVKRYAIALMKESVQDDYVNNLADILQKVSKENKTGYIISRFLFRAAENGEIYDYYKVFIEIL